MKEFNTLVFIGRFQPFHNGHKAVIDKALEKADKVIVLIGSSFAARDLRNPFTFEERKEMIESVYSDQNVLCLPLSDYPYSDQKWISKIQELVKNNTNENEKIGLIGHSKDHTSYYLNLFPDWGSVEVENVDEINATFIRNQILSYKWQYNILKLSPLSQFLPLSVANTIAKFMFTGKKIHENLSDGRQNWTYEQTEAFRTLYNEYHLIKQYKDSWKDAPYPPIFVTTDAVVTQSGHILLIKRKSAPGMGQWALPGGFLEQNETVLEGMLRELNEETKIKVPKRVLQGSIKEQKVFDYPHRSTRGRTITHAFWIDLETQAKLPKVKGSDDAEKASWVKLSDLKQDELFEDHYHIIDDFLNISK